jgi:hypothetical protein
MYTATQNIAQRGHRENEQSSNRGNFLELLKLFRNTIPLLKKKLDEDLPQNAKYTSPQIQNEILYTGVPKKEDESITPLFIGRF